MLNLINIFMSTETTEQKVPTREQVLKFYAEQIEIAGLRKDLAELLAVTAEFDARRAEAVAKQAHFASPRPQASPDQMPEGMIEHVVSQEDMDNNPELAEQGIKVGDVIGISNNAAEAQPQSEVDPANEVPVKKLKKQ
jgi:hypothetical protein